MAQVDEGEGLAARVARLEEEQGFAERKFEALSAEVYALGRRIEEIGKRVGRLEEVGRGQEEEGAAL